MIVIRLAYIAFIHREKQMVRTQIYLTKREHERIRRVAIRTAGRRARLLERPWISGLISRGNQRHDQVLAELFGIWRGRSDLPNFDALRHEADRVMLPDRQ